MARRSSAHRSSERIELYDTTLRDGSQGEGISYSVDDKIKIASRLDEFGMDFIEGGWPGSNPKDEEFFNRMKSVRLRRAKLAAFGSTCRAGLPPEDDFQIRKLAEASTPVITIFGKSWEQHILHALNTTLEENLRMIADSVKFLTSHCEQVIYDAEHFFDGYTANPQYAIRCLDAALNAGAQRLVLCDTNGGTLPDRVAEVVRRVQAHFGTPVIGIHTHNDSECAVANALAAVQEGAIHVQGTVNGYGERCGNCNLLSVAPNLLLKMGRECGDSASLAHLTALSQYVDEIANLTPDSRRAYVGKSAFAHKGGVHADAVLKGASYEHIDPARVGNTRRLLVSELAGGASISGKAAEYGFDFNRKSPETRALLKTITEREHAGYSYEGAEASFELLMMQHAGKFQAPFHLNSFRCRVEQRYEGDPITEATVKVSVNGKEKHTVAEGDGPVHALDGALRKALTEDYPDLAGIRLTDFKVRVVNTREGTSAQVRVIIDSTDGETPWSTVGVSTNMIEASCHALVESIMYGLLRCGRRK
jgi:2-isopropylmalate synthase